jgi:glycerol kinase
MRSVCCSKPRSAGSAELVELDAPHAESRRGALEVRLDQAMPGAHGLTLLPFFENRGAVSGLSLATEPFHLLLAALESIALRCREACNALGGLLGPAREVIASARRCSIRRRRRK